MLILAIVYNISNFTKNILTGLVIVMNYFSTNHFFTLKIKSLFYRKQNKKNREKNSYINRKFHYFYLILLIFLAFTLLIISIVEFYRCSCKFESKQKQYKY